MFLGLRTVVYPTTDLASSKAWFAEVLGRTPYFDQPFYVGFDVGGYELGLLPADLAAPPTTYWGVTAADAGLAHLVAHGATVRDPVSDVGDGIRTAAAIAPDGSVVGVIENPHFDPAKAAASAGTGPGR
jgi:catechol 2,3-dioxygenase-like lactoylglutathione lyase family enzyme